MPPADLIQTRNCFGFKYLSAQLILAGTIEPTMRTRMWGLHFFESISEVPIHQSSSVKQRKVFESKTVTDLTHIRPSVKNCWNPFL